MTDSPPVTTASATNHPPARLSRGLDVSPLRERDARVIVASMAASKLGPAKLSYGGMVYPA
jgi:hypothetical protein